VVALAGLLVARRSILSMSCGNQEKHTDVVNNVMVDSNTHHGESKGGDRTNEGKEPTAFLLVRVPHFVVASASFRRAEGKQGARLLEAEPPEQ